MFVAENEDFLEAVAGQAGQVAQVLRDNSLSRAEIEVWAACKHLVDRAGRDQPARYLRAVDAFLAEVARLSSSRTRRRSVVQRVGPLAPMS